jgi:NAD(P)-dependent dehydrogenase (short-subunit alcohol dehydrogenase family)
LQDKVAVVTGGGSGIGRAIAVRFAAEGARVVVAGQTVAKLEESARLARERGGEATAVRCDIADLQQVRDLMRAAVEKYGRLDILVNNAALNRNEPIPETVAEMPEDWWAANLDVNLTGHYYCSKYALREMLKAGSGVIVNVASTNGLTGNWNQAAYIAAKHGMIGLTKSMALDYARKGIRVVAVCPGFTETERAIRHMQMNRPAGWRERSVENIPLGRMGRPEEIANAALFLASDEASFITGVALPVDGGNAARR